MEPITLDQAIEMLKSEYPHGVELWYVDYRDNLSENTDLLVAIINQDHDTINESMMDMYHDCDYCTEIVNELFSDFDIESIEQEIRDRLYENNTFEPMKQLIKNTGSVRLRLVYRTNYDSMVRGDMDDELWQTSTANCYQDLVDQNIMSKQALDECLSTEWANIGSDYGHFTFVWEIDLADLYNRETNKIRVSTGTQFWLHNSWTGTCGLIESTTTEDIIIDLDWKWATQYDYRDLVLDSEDWYWVDEVCGMTSAYRERWGFSFLSK